MLSQSCILGINLQKEEDQKVPFSSHHIKGTCQHGLSTTKLTLIVCQVSPLYSCSPSSQHLSTLHSLELKVILWGFPGGAAVENLPANAGDTGSSPGLGGSHVPWGNWAREPQLLSLRVWSLCSATREAAIVRGPCTTMKSGPRLPQLEKAFTQKRRPNTAKNK